MSFKGEGFLEELRDHIVSEAALGYVSGETITVGFSPDPVQDYPALLSATRNLLTLYGSGGTLRRSSSLVHQDRSVRFVHRGDHPQDAVNRLWRVVEWLETKKKHMTLPSFAVRFLRHEGLPTVSAVEEDRTALADVTLAFLVISRVVESS